MADAHPIGGLSIGATHRMSPDNPTYLQRALAGARLVGLIVFWLIAFVPCTLWFLAAVAISATKRPAANDA